MQPSKGSSFALTAGFVAVLLMPTADALLELDPAPPLRELRRLAEFPEVSWKWNSVRDLPTELEAYIDDHFGFRGSLVRLHGLIRLFLMDNTPGSQVVIGREGWLYVNSDRGLMENHRGFARMTEEQLELWKARLEERRDALAARGIKYLFVVAPDKHSIYPEFVPARARRIGPHDQLDQLVDYLRENSTVDVVDPRSALKKEKKRAIVYHRTDHHWNDLGAWVAYREIQDRVATWFPLAKPHSFEDFQMTVERSAGWETARLLALQDYLVEEEMVVLHPLRPTRAVRTTENVLALSGRPRRTALRAPFAMETGNSDLPRAVVFRDSFVTPLIPFLSEHYERVVYYWQAFEWAAIPHEEPDVVIEEKSERGVLRRVPASIRGRPGEAGKTEALLAAGD